MRLPWLIHGEHVGLEFNRGVCSHHYGRRAAARRPFSPRDPMKTIELEQALIRLYALRTHGIKPGLEPVRALLARLGDPQNTFAAIHVAGTNGKGSVCAMLDAILRAGGYRVGLYISPHLLQFNERIRIDGNMIEDADLAALFDKLEPAAAAVNQELGREVTFFEFATALAFEYFREKGVKIVILETGLGGRLDATNVVTPLVSVITRIGIDHTRYLGDTIEAIAAEKAGIIKAGRPVICGAMTDGARAVIRRVSMERQAPFTAAEEVVDVAVKSQGLDGLKMVVDSPGCDYGAMRLPLAGSFQVENVATAIATLETVAAISPIKVEPAAVRQGLAGVRWPGRMQIICDDPLTLLDGAHNPDAAAALVASLRKVVRKRPVALVCGMCADKDARGFIAIAGAAAKVIWTVPLRTDRGLAPQDLAAIAGGPGRDIRIATAVSVAIDEAKAWAREHGGVVCIAGSLYLVGEVLELLGWGEQARGW